MSTKLEKVPTSVADEFSELIDRMNNVLDKIEKRRIDVTTEPMLKHLECIHTECVDLLQKLSVDDPGVAYQFSTQTELVDRAVSVMNQVDILEYTTSKNHPS